MSCYVHSIKPQGRRVKHLTCIVLSLLCRLGNYHFRKTLKLEPPWVKWKQIVRCQNCIFKVFFFLGFCVRGGQVGGGWGVTSRVFWSLRANVDLRWTNALYSFFHVFTYVKLRLSSFFSVSHKIWQVGQIDSCISSQMALPHFNCQKKIKI